MTQAPHVTLASVIIWIYIVLSVFVLFHFLLLFLLPMSSTVTALLAWDGFTGSLEFFLLCGTHFLRLSIILTLNICFPFLFISYSIVYPQQTLKYLWQTLIIFSPPVFLSYFILLCCPVHFQLCNFSINYHEYFRTMPCDLCYLCICCTYDLWLTFVRN